MNQTWENSQKHGFGPDFGPNLGGQIFFSKIWLCQSLDIMICYTSWSSCTIPETIQYWENLVTDGQTDDSDFVGRRQTNVERPTYLYQWN